MAANDKQVGGSHYQSGGRQHWDLMIQFNVPYIVGCASKYLWRWKKKNGIQDLEKAIHYIEKMIEVWPSILPSVYARVPFNEINIFDEQEKWDTRTYDAICLILHPRGTADLDHAIGIINAIIAIEQRQKVEETPNAATLHPA